MYIVNHILLWYNCDILGKECLNMSPSEAQKRASNKYIKEHMATLGCKVRKEEAAAFKDYASKQGKTANTVLKEYVLKCIEGEIIIK